MPKDPMKPDVHYFRVRIRTAALVFLGVIGFLLVFEHRAHLPGGYILLGVIVGISLLTPWLIHGRSRGRR